MTRIEFEVEAATLRGLRDRALDALRALLADADPLMQKKMTLESFDTIEYDVTPLVKASNGAITLWRAAVSWVIP